jgi:hypothetical protein
MLDALTALYRLLGCPVLSDRSKVDTLEDGVVVDRADVLLYLLWPNLHAYQAWLSNVCDKCSCLCGTSWCIVQHSCLTTASALLLADMSRFRWGSAVPQQRVAVMDSLITVYEAAILMAGLPVPS